MQMNELKCKLSRASVVVATIVTMGLISSISYGMEFSLANSPIKKGLNKNQGVKRTRLDF